MKYESKRKLAAHRFDYVFPLRVKTSSATACGVFQGKGGGRAEGTRESEPGEAAAPHFF